MPQPPIDPALQMFALGMMLLSIIACMNVVVMRRRGSVLPYEPRRPVPWGAIGGVLAMVLLLSVAGSALIGGSPADVDEAPKEHTASGLGMAMLLQVFIVSAFVVAIKVFTKATAIDLGLPTNKDKSIRDVLAGAAACLAALAPVFMTQNALLSLFYPKQMEEMTSGHPMIKMVMAAPDPMILVLTGIATVVVAPICEEITFRLLLQGWLERWEDQRLGWRTPVVETPPPDSETQITSDAPITTEPVPLDTASAPPNPTPPLRGIGGMPYGWFPIVVSAASFGLAHYGYGPEPVPIFLLGLVLGFLYQRTHRILPGIVAHALFNLFTMIMLWRMIYHHG